MEGNLVVAGRVKGLECLDRKAMAVMKALF